MLIYLKIKNFAIIESIELTLKPNMTVLTGETGAGKSIIVDTLALTFGAKTDSSIIKKGASNCNITAIFDVGSLPKAKQYLIAKELFCADNDDECIVTRSIGQDGRSRYTVNNISCTQSIARELGNFLLDFYGQHEHQNLLKHETQRDLLDAFSDNTELVLVVKNIYKELSQAQNKLTALKDVASSKEQKLDFLRYKIKEFDELSLTSGETEKLHQELKFLNQTENILTNCDKVLKIINENDDTTTVLKNLYTAKSLLEKISTLNPKLQNAIILLKNATIQTETCVDEIKNLLTSLDLNDERLIAIESRLNKIHDLARKHRTKPEDLPLLYETIKNELAKLETFDNTIDQLEKEVSLLKTAYDEEARKLTAKRQKSALKLAELVTEKMQHLGMEGGVFAINLVPYEKEEYNSYGMEKIEFLVSTNCGQALMPINKIISGGELSRLGLAIAVITAETSKAPTLIFDEVDVGIGGKTAQIVGELLKKIAKSIQVICITHLPQVAALGDQHLRVEKNNKNAAVFLNIKCLEKEDRIAEIARMLGGINITAKTIAHAKEMLNHSFHLVL